MVASASPSFLLLGPFARPTYYRKLARSARIAATLTANRQIKSIGLAGNRRVRQHFEAIRGCRDLPFVQSALCGGEEVRARQISGNIAYRKESE
jgi:hypothetical protein